MDIRHNESIWPEDSVARVPYWVYQDLENYTRELGRLFEGRTWNYVCLEADIPNKGDFRTNVVGALLHMGLAHGLYCLGCYWILMTLLFVVGAMNLLWVAGRAAVVLFEKPLRPAFGSPASAVFYWRPGVRGC